MKTPEPGNPPERIYLQWEGDADEPDPTVPYEQRGEITWCQDKIFKLDVEYIRSDAQSSLQNRVTELEAMCDRLAEVITVILPMAKGWAHEHPVGNNAAMVKVAQLALADYRTHDICGFCEARMPNLTNDSHETEIRP